MLYPRLYAFKLSGLLYLLSYQPPVESALSTRMTSPCSDTPSCSPGRAHHYKTPLVRMNVRGNDAGCDNDTDWTLFFLPSWRKYLRRSPPTFSLPKEIARQRAD